MSMIVGVPRETAALEKRVALIPDSVARLVKAGHEVLVGEAAGLQAGFPDAAYVNAGARIVAAEHVFRSADVVLKVNRPIRPEGAAYHEAELLREGSAVICFMQPTAAPDLIAILAERRISSFAMELVPRITRAQAMDALSSQSTVAGYKAVLMAADAMGRFFPMLMTAAGTIPPARVLVLGAGVAGLQAIATARRLGAVVEAFDTRPAVKEQVQSLGAKFVEIDVVHNEQAEDAGGYAKELADETIQRERALIHERCTQADVVITTALVPGKRAPLLIAAETVKGMKPGSVIVDLAGESGGNCETSVAGEKVVENGVTILAPLNLPSELPYHASQLYARNIVSLFEHLARGQDTFAPSLEDEITRAVCVTHAGEIMHGPTRALVGAAA
jgi:H+-translocating NAD(P) transhydrogenase subunit alpha